jgi:hypothetical protein
MTSSPVTMVPTASPVVSVTPSPVFLPFVWLTASGNVYATAQFAPALGNLTGSYLADQIISNTFVDLTGASTVTYSVGSLALASTTSISFTYASPANIVGILKTPAVYYSTENGASSVYVRYSLTDAAGRSQCSPTSVTVVLTVGAATSACSVFSTPAAPFGSCSLAVNSVLFSTAGSTLAVSVSLLVNSVVMQTTSLGTVTLAPIPTQSNPSAVGIYFQMPIYVAVPGDTVTVEMWAQTGGTDTMGSWGASLVYDTSLLSFVSVSHPLYTTVLTNTAIMNALNITGSGGSGGITGWFLAATISFTVTPAATGTTVLISMPAILTNAMTNSVPITYNNNFNGLFADSRGGWTFTTGQLLVLNPSVAGVYAYSGVSTFVNTLNLNGILSADVMTVMASYNTGRSYPAYADIAVAPQSCSSSLVLALSASSVGSGCYISLSATGGGSSISVTATYNSFTAVVAYRAFTFLSFSLQSTRTQLRRIGCDYETSFLTAYGVVTLDSVTPLVTVDISELVTFTSSNPSFVSIAGRVANGLNIGSSTVSYGGGLASVGLTVSVAVASVVQLVTYAYTSATVSPTSLSNTELASTIVRVTPVLSLTAELQTAFLVSYAQHDDGVWTDVSHYPSLNLSSIAASDLDVTYNGVDWQLVVPVGASTVSGSLPVISGTLRDSCSAPLTTLGYGYAKTNLSVPIAIVVTAGASSMARPGTPAATTLGITTSTLLVVTVTFRSSTGVLSYIDFTSDVRTSYSTNFSVCTGTLSAPNALSLSSSVGGGMAGSVTILVTMPTYSAAAGLSGSLTIPVLDVAVSVPLIGSLVHAMTPSVPVNSGTPLVQLGCTGVYQTGLLATVQVTLTDSSTRTGTPVLVSGNVAVATVSGTSVTALSPGSAAITATYATATGIFTAYVSAAATSITSVTLSYGANTLSGQTGASSAGSVAVSFADGTSFANAVASFSPLSALLGFNSSDPTFVAVSAFGVASLVNNSWAFAVLTAFSKCPDGHSSSFSMAGNLAPVSFDTKLGSSSGLTFPAKSNGQTVDASVYVQVASSPLTTYQLWLFYNQSVFGSPTIVKGAGWSVGAFAFTTGNAVSGDIVKAILSFSSGSSATNTLVPMATVSFPVITPSPALQLITANVVALSVASGIIFQSATGSPIVAGTAYVSLNGGTVPQFRRRTLLLLENDSATGRGLLQAASLPLVTGDCNGDGLFNANDATYAQLLVTNGVSSWPTSSIVQMRNCAPTYSYMFNNVLYSYTAFQISITIADVAFLLSASTNRLFFLNISTPFDLVTAVPYGTSQPWDATATFYYYPSSTSVAAYTAVPCATTLGHFEMNVAALPYSVAVGSLYGSTAKGVAFEGFCSAGTFAASVITDWQNTVNMSLGFVNSATGDAYAFFGMDVGAYINANTNFVNVKGSTIVSGPILTYNVSASPTTVVPTATPTSSAPTTTTSPSSSLPTNIPSTAPTSSAPTTTSPSSSLPTDIPSTAPTSSAPTTTSPSSSPPTAAPSTVPSLAPSSFAPSDVPSNSPSDIPSNFPSAFPSSSPVAGLYFNILVQFLRRILTF